MCLYEILSLLFNIPPSQSIVYLSKQPNRIFQLTRAFKVASHKDAEESEKQHEENGEAWRAVSLGQIGPETECVGTSLPLLYTTIGPQGTLNTNSAMAK